jgi:antitoxin (DNA-binding transcriptional repressor) of toxin-antitoxin stability system
MKTLPSTQARRFWARLLGRVEHRGQRFGIERSGRLVAAVIPYGEVDILDQLEDELDFQRVREAIDLHRGQERLRWEDVLAYDGGRS